MRNRATLTIIGGLLIITGTVMLFTNQTNRAATESQTSDGTPDTWTVHQGDGFVTFSSYHRWAPGELESLRKDQLTNNTTLTQQPVDEVEIALLGTVQKVIGKKIYITPDHLLNPLAHPNDFGSKNHSAWTR